MKNTIHPELKEVPISDSQLVYVINEIADYLIELGSRRDQNGGREELLNHLTGYARGLKVTISRRGWFIPTGEKNEYL